MKAMIESERETTETENLSDELVRRHRTASRFVLAILGLTGALVAIAAVAGERFNRSGTVDPTLLLALQIVVPLVFGLGAIA